ncbi:MAG: tRNA dihydrouridine synthase DusB [Tissierellaceae bacterium]
MYRGEIMNIGNIKLSNNIFLAPMAGITDLSFRTICREKGAGLVFTEMVSAKGLYYKDKGTEMLTKIGNSERPVGIQIFGSDPKIMASIVEKDLNLREEIDIIDINMGCPAPKIVKNQDGSALMKDPKLIREILKNVIKVSKKPVTIKIRMGWDSNMINGIDIAKIAEEEGVSALTIHGRTRDMFYSGKADWDFIAKVKESVSIPVIGNGDVFEPQDGIDLMNHTRCDAIAIGRGAMGNPWIFERIQNLMEEKADRVPNVKEIIDMAIRHLDMVCEMKGERVGIREMRKHLAWYLKGMKNSNEVKNKINMAESREMVKGLLIDYLEKNSI